MIRTIFISLVLAIVVAYFYVNFFSNKKDIDYCNSDEDCVPKECCHPTQCINKIYKQSCDGIFCTMECRTILDCGYGKCSCINNKCVVVPLK